MYPLFCISDAVKQLKFGVSNNAIESHMDNAMSSSCVVGKAVALKIEAETPTDWKADGMDLQYINVTAVDKKGRPVWTYNEPLTLQIEGSARLVALDNSDHYTSDLFNGK